MLATSEIQDRCASRGSNELWDDQIQFTGRLLELFARYRHLLSQCLSQCECSHSLNTSYHELERQYKLLLMEKVNYCPSMQPPRMLLPVAVENDSKAVACSTGTPLLLSTTAGGDIRTWNTGADLAFPASPQHCKDSPGKDKPGAAHLSASDGSSGSTDFPLPKVESLLKFENTTFAKSLSLGPTTESVSPSPHASARLQEGESPSPRAHFEVSGYRPSASLVVPRSPAEISAYLLPDHRASETCSQTGPGGGFQEVHLVEPDSGALAGVTGLCPLTTTVLPVTGSDTRPLTSPPTAPNVNHKKVKLLSGAASIFKKKVALQGALVGEGGATGEQLKALAEQRNCTFWRIEAISTSQARTEQPHSGAPLLEYFRCEVGECHFATTARLDLKAHLRSAHQVYRPYKCDFANCTASFKERYKLKVHSVVHTGEKPFLCDWPGCKLRFSQSGHMSRHRKSHLFKNKHPCSWPGCSRTFIQKHNLKTHLMRHRGEKPWRCEQDECGKSFLEKWKLAKHQKTHMRNGGNLPG